MRFSISLADNLNISIFYILKTFYQYFAFIGTKQKLNKWPNRRKNISFSEGINFQ